MSREILFRGKRVGSGKWIEGYLVEVDYPEYRCLIIRYLELDINESGKDIIGHEMCEVIPETVGQYTGLTDKNGVKIFDGDILTVWRARGNNGQLRGKYIYPLPVEYCDTWCQFVAVDKPNKEQFGIWQQFGAYEVIGNVFDKDVKI